MVSSTNKQIQPINHIMRIFTHFVYSCTEVYWNQVTLIAEGQLLSAKTSTNHMILIAILCSTQQTGMADNIKV
jgi:hypothetical protein